MLANNPPDVAAEQNAHTPPLTAPGPSRNRAAKNASAIAPTNSPNAERSGGGRAGGSDSSTAKPTNQPRNTSTRARNRRSHERTVEHDSPNAAAIGRYPRPSAAIPSAHPTASTTSNRRPSRNPGNSACVRSQTLQRARLTSSLNLPRPTRTRRRYPPHDPSSPAQRGQRIPATSDGPTPALSIGPTHRLGTATISTGTSQEGPSDLAKTGALYLVQGHPKSRAPDTGAPAARSAPCRHRRSGYRPMPNLNDEIPGAMPNSSDAQHSPRSDPNPYSPGNRSSPASLGRRRPMNCETRAPPQGPDKPVPPERAAAKAAPARSPPPPRHGRAREAHPHAD